MAAAAAFPAVPQTQPDKPISEKRLNLLFKKINGRINLFASILLCACVSVLLFPDYFENSHICVFG